MEDVKTIYSNERVKIYLKDGICTKKMYHSHLFNNFAEYHNKFHKFIRNSDNYLKIIEIKDPATYTMEYLDIYSTVDRYLDPWNPDFNTNIKENILDDILRVFLQLQIDCIEFSKTLEPGKHWIHKDLHLSNFVITKDRQVKLIDMDSFVISGSPANSSYIGTFAVLMSRLQHAYNTMGWDTGCVYDTKKNHVPYKNNHDPYFRKNGVINGRTN